MTIEERTIDNLVMEAIQEKCILDTTEKIEYPPIAISIGEKRFTTKDGIKTYPIPIGTYGNFSFVQAPPKTKKTFFISLLASVYLSGTNKFGGDLKGHRDDKCLLHFDTEQGKWHCQKVFRRVLDMNDTEKDENYHTFTLRTIGYKTRLEFIEYWLREKVEENKAGLVIIDGVADLISDVNNLEESNSVVQKLMEWTAKFNCHIVTIIHSNYGSSKPTGHLGSLLEKKAETQIELEKNTVHEEHITVRCRRSRGFPFETFSFKVNDYGYPIIVGNLYDHLQGVEIKHKKLDFD